MITVTLNRTEFEYDIHSLIKAFFPKEEPRGRLRRFFENTRTAGGGVFTEQTSETWINAVFAVRDYAEKMDAALGLPTNLNGATFRNAMFFTFMSQNQNTVKLFRGRGSLRFLAKAGALWVAIGKALGGQE